MANKLKCTECQHEFRILKGDELKCPECGSVHVTFQSSTLFRSWQGYLAIAVLVASAVMVYLLMFHEPAECLPPEITAVEVDSVARTITIKAVAASPGCRLTYSIDNNRTGAYPSPEFTHVAAGTYYICVIYGEDPDARVMWEGNPVVMPAVMEEPSLPPPQVVGVEATDPTARGPGEIVVHALSAGALEYVLNDSLRQRDSIFSRVGPGRYTVSVVDSLGREDRYPEEIVLVAPPRPETAAAAPCTNPDQAQLQEQINSLFSDRRGDQELQQRILAQFANRRVTVTGSLLNTTQQYTIYQYLYRQNIGLPGSIRVTVNNLRFNDQCKITNIEIQENGEPETQGE